MIGQARCRHALLFVLLCPGTVIAQQVDPEWPCIQRLVESVAPAVMWPLPVDETMSKAWRAQDDIRALAQQLGDIDTYTDEHRAQVESFANALPAESKEAQLSLLAVGILDVTNELRRHYITGIKRYTRQQIAIAAQIEGTLNEVSELEDSTAAEATARREELMSTLRWHERVYDQREQAILSLCEQPVELEETMSDVLRDLAQYLP